MRHQAQAEASVHSPHPAFEKAGAAAERLGAGDAGTAFCAARPPKP